jgi:hypothetical protein
VGRGVLAVVLAAAFAGGAGAAAGPGVTITSVRPVTVAGRGFVARERVRVVVHTKRTQVTNVVATARGRFVVRYPLAVGDCTAVRVLARGNRGSRASYSVTPTCAPLPG